MIRTLLIGIAFLAHASHALGNAPDPRLQSNLMNILYFEQASISTSNCEARGFPTRSIYRDWLVTNNPIHENISSEVLHDFVEKGLTHEQAAAALAGIREKYRINLRKEIHNSNTICGAFREYLRSFGTLKNSRFPPVR